MTTPDNIFAEALERLDRGETPQRIAQDYKDYQQELEGLLSVADMGMNIPRLTPPIPYKEFRFAEKAVTSSGFMHLLSYGRVAIIPISLVIALLGGRFAVNATENSLPGDKLYSIKRASEEARLNLTRDQEKVATLHIELMQKRLSEVRKAADTGNVESETAAIAELESQTKKTFEEVTPVAAANALSKQDSSLLDTLIAVNKEQKDVLATLSETVTVSALENNKENDVTLAKIIATVNDQALVDLSNKISVTGDVTSHYGSKITVEKNVFTIDNDTIVTGTDGEKITDAETIKGRVTITGTRTENGILIAKQISLLPADGEVKGDSEVVPTRTPTTKPATKPTVPSTNEPDPTVEPIPQPTPNKATGSYITEPSTPQYSE